MTDALDFEEQTGRAEQLDKDEQVSYTRQGVHILELLPPDQVLVEEYPNDNTYVVSYWSVIRHIKAAGFNENTLERVLSKFHGSSKIAINWDRKQIMIPSDPYDTDLIHMWLNRARAMWDRKEGFKEEIDEEIIYENDYT